MLQIISGAIVVLFTIILSAFIETYLFRNNDDLLVYIKNCYKDKALILIILIELILLILIELNSMFLIYYFVIYFLYRICLIDIKTKLIDIKLLIALIVVAIMSTVAI